MRIALGLIVLILSGCASIGFQTDTEKKLAAYEFAIGALAKKALEHEAILKAKDIQKESDASKS